jgi:hypothetical protein
MGASNRDRNNTCLFSWIIVPSHEQGTKAFGVIGKNVSPSQQG